MVQKILILFAILESPVRNEKGWSESYRCWSSGLDQQNRWWFRTLDFSDFCLVIKEKTKELESETHFKDTFRVFSKDEEGRDILEKNMTIWLYFQAASRQMRWSLCWCICRGRWLTRRLMRWLKLWTGMETGRSASQSSGRFRFWSISSSYSFEFSTFSYAFVVVVSKVSWILLNLFLRMICRRMYFLPGSKWPLGSSVYDFWKRNEIKNFYQITIVKVLFIVLMHCRVMMGGFPLLISDKPVKKQVGEMME